MGRNQVESQKKVRRIIADAVRQSRLPNQASLGTTGAATGSIVSPSLNFATVADEDGNTKIPMLWDVDNWDEAFWQ